MVDTIVRKCGGCTNPVEIKRNNVENIVFYKLKYYHSKCFCDIATKRSSKNTKTAQEWKDALDNFVELERDTKNKLDNSWSGDDLNEWLLDHYNITKAPDRIWSMLADLNKGKYKNKRCEPISTELILETWKWGQRKLDSIARNNKMSNKGPADDSARIIYDFSIIVSKVPNYLSHQAKMKMIHEEEKKESEKTYIDYDNIPTAKVERDTTFDDISTLLDEIF